MVKIRQHFWDLGRYPVCLDESKCADQKRLNEVIQEVIRLFIDRLKADLTEEYRAKLRDAVRNACDRCCQRYDSEREMPMAREELAALDEFEVASTGLLELLPPQRRARCRNEIKKDHVWGLIERRGTHELELEKIHLTLAELVRAIESAKQGLSRRSKGRPATSLGFEMFVCDMADCYKEFSGRNAAAGSSRAGDRRSGPFVDFVWLAWSLCEGRCEQITKDQLANRIRTILQKQWIG